MSETEPLFAERHVLESQTPRYLARLVLDYSQRIAEAERSIGLINDVLTGQGTSIEEQLDLINETEITSIKGPASIGQDDIR
jgi:hypothetical protein